MFKKAQSFKSKRGFTLVEIVCVVVLLGILGGIGVSLMRDTTTTGRANALAKNATEINNGINNMRAAGTTFNVAAAAYSYTPGTATSGATLNFQATTNAADVNSFLTQLAGAGILSYGNTASLGRSITNASYTYTIANGVPVFEGTAGANP